MFSSPAEATSEDPVSLWHSSARKKVFPPPFPDMGAEQTFLCAYRLAGLSSVRHACTVGIIAYVALGLVDFVTSGWNPNASLRRLIAITLLVALVLLIVTQPSRVLRHYSLLLGSLSAFTIVGLVSVMHLFREENVRELVAPLSLLARAIVKSCVCIDHQAAAWRC